MKIVSIFVSISFPMTDTKKLIRTKVVNNLIKIFFCLKHFLTKCTVCKLKQKKKIIIWINTSLGWLMDIRGLWGMIREMVADVSAQKSFVQNFLHIIYCIIFLANCTGLKGHHLYRLVIILK